MDYDKALDRVAKLLSLSKSDNANEAAQAAAQAQAIMDKYNISASMMEEGKVEEPDEDIVDFGKMGAPLDDSGRLANWKVQLCMKLAHNNACKVYTQNGYQSRSLNLVGRPSDVQTVRYFYGYLVREVERLRKKQMKGLGGAWYTQFRYGVVDTIGNKLAEQRKVTLGEVREEAFARNGETALVLVNNAIQKFEQRGQDVDDWVKENMKLRKAPQVRSGYAPGGRQAGREAGKSISLGNCSRKSGKRQKGSQRLKLNSDINHTAHVPRLTCAV